MDLQPAQTRLVISLDLQDSRPREIASVHQYCAYAAHMLGRRSKNFYFCLLNFLNGWANQKCEKKIIIGRNRSLRIKKVLQPHVSVHCAASFNGLCQTW